MSSARPFGNIRTPLAAFRPRPLAYKSWHQLVSPIDVQGTIRAEGWKIAWGDPIRRLGLDKGLVVVTSIYPGENSSARGYISLYSSTKLEISDNVLLTVNIINGAMVRLTQGITVCDSLDDVRVRIECAPAFPFREACLEALRQISRSETT